MANVRILAAAMLVLAPGAAWAGKPRVDGAKLLDSLLQCQDIADSTQRLACFDAQVGPLKTAREQNKKIFATKVEPQKFVPITVKAIGVTEMGDGSWLIVLADNTIWRTEDIVRFEPARGDMVKITKGALGSFNANIGNQNSVKVRQVH